MNLLTDVMPKILSSALITLRENAIMPRIVNSDYSADAAKQGNVIQVPVPTKMTAQDVVPGAYSTNTPDLQIDTVPIPLNYWKESTFALTDKEMLEVMDGVSKMQITEAAKAIANEVDKSLFGLYKGIYNYTGTAGTTPFTDATPNDILKVRKVLNNGLAPMGDRRVVLNSDAESQALSLQAFQFYLNSGSTETMTEGSIGRKFGFDWFMDQNAANHVAGTIAGTLVTSGVPQSISQVDANNPALRNPRTVNSVTIGGATAAQTVKAGDIFSVAGDSQTYVVTSDTVVAGSTVTVGFNPAPKVIWASGSAVTVRASRAINMAFHRDAIALAIRPLEQSMFEAELGGKIMTMVDPITGIPLRLEVRREYKRLRFSLDCLWGVGLVRPENAVVLAG